MTGLRTLLLDLDGTLIADQGGAGRDSQGVRLLAGVIEGLRLFRDAGYRFFVVTNQGGIGLGAYSEQDFLACVARAEELLLQEGLTIASVEYCPHAPDAGCPCRKPATGMWDALCKKYPDLTAETALMIGDKDRDVLLGKAIGCRTARVRSSVYPET